MLFTWDTEKAKSNLIKHSVSFEEACQVFQDPFHISVLDARFSCFEERWISLGMSKKQRLLVVAHLLFTDEGEEVLRIISARKASKNEQKQYEAY